MRTKTSVRLRHSAALLAVSTMIVGGVPALAQSSDAQTTAQTGNTQSEDSSSTDAADIVVTAQFRTQRLQDTPIAITAMNSATLQARSQTNIVDIGQFAPSVNLSNAASFNGNAVAAFIRGIGQEQASFAFEPGVGIYIDDVYYGTTFGAALDLTDLDRVEVLRGPQGTLAGKNSLGGAIKLFSKKPDGNGGGFAEATYGSYNRMEVRASGNFTIAPGLYARVSGVARRRDGFVKQLDFGCVYPAGGTATFVDAGGVSRPVNPPLAQGGIPAGTATDNCVVGREGGGNLFALRASLRYAPTGSPLEVNVTIDHSRDDSEQVATKLAVATNPLSLANSRSYFAANPAGGIPFDNRFITGARSYTNFANYSASGNYTTVFGTPYQVAPGTFTDRPENSANSWGIAGTVDYDLGGGFSIKSITAYRKAWGTSVTDSDGTPVNVLKQRLDNTHKQFTEELRISGKIGSIADLTIGGFYYKANDLARYRIQIPIDLFDFLTDDPVSNRSIAAFGHLELHATERLNLIAGLRYTDDKKTYTFHRLNPDGVPIGFRPGEEIISVPSPVPVFPLNALNGLVAGLNGAASTAKDQRVDYRAGINYRFSDALMAYAQMSTGYKGGGINSQPFVLDQVQPFSPEKLTTYEAGFKSDLFDRRVRLNGAAFLSNYSDIQRTVFFCPESTSTQCAQTKNIADARYKGIELETTVRPLDGLTFDGSLTYIHAEYTKIKDASAGITLGMAPPFASEWQASAGIQYSFDLVGGRLTPRADWSYLSDFFYNAQNRPENKVPGRDLFNARLTYETGDGAWSVSAAVTNLFDKFYEVGVGENIAGLGNSNTVLGRPREWSLSVRRKF
ncbi:MAG: TonB-dependent receptor [Sphingobium sp.]|nr:TonB-dependent receptor [Sphingobium sp.]